jgi:hypothetical protein
MRRWIVFCEDTIMDLINRYLHAVRSYLPKAQQDDIIRELSANLASRVEDREAELGHPLSDDETADLLGDYGHPMLFAARYQPPRYLIGPTVYPMYIRILLIALIACLVVNAGVAVALSGTSGLYASLGVLRRLPSVLIATLGWITGVFVAIEWALPHVSIVSRWDPRSLPPVPRSDAVVSRFNAAVEFFVTTVCVCWWIATRHSAWLVLGPSTSMLALGAGWHAAYVPVLALMLWSMLLSALDLARPYRTAARTIARLAGHAAALVLALVLMRVGSFVVLAQPGAAPESLPTLVNGVIQACLVGAVVLATIGIVREGMRLRRITLPQMPSLV